GFIGYKILSVKTLGDIGTLVSLVGVVVLLLKGISLLMPSDTASARKQVVLDERRNPTGLAEFQAAEAPPLLSGERPTLPRQTTNRRDPGAEGQRGGARTTHPTSL